MLTAGMKQYIKQIYLLSDGDDQIPPVLLANALGIGPSSVSRMARKLSHHGVIENKHYGKIYLTEEGKQLGQTLVRQHEVLKQFLEIIGIKEPHILKELEEIEFNVSACVIERINMLNQYFSQDQSRVQTFYQFVITGVTGSNGPTGVTGVTGATGDNG